MDIFDKLDKLEIQVLDRLDMSDRDHVVFIDKCYKGKHDYLLGIHTELLEMQKKYNETEYFARNSQQNPFHYENYDLDSLVRKSKDSLSALKSYYVSKLLSYFEEKYNIKFTNKWENRKRVDNLAEEPQLEQILGFIFEFMGGVSFVDTAKKNLKLNLLDFLVRHSVELKGDSIHFPYILYVSKKWNGNYEIDNTAFLKTLTLCISVFEFSNIENVTGYKPANYSMSVNLQEAIYFPNCKKVNSFKVFKNGKLSLKFTSKADAAEFWNYFQLNTAIK